MNQRRHRLRYSLGGLLALVALSALIFSIVIPRLKAPLSSQCLRGNGLAGNTLCYKCHMNTTTVALAILVNRPTAQASTQPRLCPGTGKMSSNCMTCHKAIAGGS